MKKGLIGLLAAVMLLTAGTGALAAGRGICRSSVDCRYTDTNNDGVCDICGAAAGCRSACRRGSVDSDGDGICDMISGVIGGPAGTNYGENISTMAITKVFSTAVLAVAAVIAMVISFFTPLIQIIYGIPLAVIGGLEIYLFGAIAAQGIAIMIEKKVDMFSSKNIAVIASIMIIGIGGNYAFGGNIPFFGLQVPCIAGAAIFGILLNLLLSIGEKKRESQE